jgi:hypothetical protein
MLAKKKRKAAAPRKPKKRPIKKRKASRSKKRVARPVKKKKASTKPKVRPAADVLDLPSFLSTTASGDAL